MPGKQLDAAIHKDHPFLFLRLRVAVEARNESCQPDMDRHLLIRNEESEHPMKQRKFTLCRFGANKATLDPFPPYLERWKINKSNRMM